MEYEEIIILGAVIAIALVILKSYMYIKASRLRKVGYVYIYYYMKNCDKLSYYRNSSDHIKKYSSNYDELNNNKDKWYLSHKSKFVIRKMLFFYILADKFTLSACEMFHLSHYFSYSEYQSIDSMASSLESSMKKLVNNEFRKFIYKETGERDLYDFPTRKYYGHKLKQNRKFHNKEVVEKELKDNKRFFDTVLKYPLDNQQRESIVKLEDNCLVISSAGSGKTSTSIAKVKYLLEKKGYKKEDILVVSYNRKTAEEFQERLDIPGLTCKTFHALALSIIGQVEGKRPDVCEPTLLLTCYYNLVRNNSKFKAAINKFVSEVSSITKNEHEYTSAEEYFKDRETYGIMAPYGDMNGSPIFTRSEEEKKICTWLSSHDVRFLYEQPYPIPTADSQHRQYKPDFTIYFNKDGKEYFCFLEHFGIDKNGNVPQWFGEGTGGFYTANIRYNNDIHWKRQLHISNKTLLMETTSAMFHDRTVFKNLEKQLRQAGVPIRELSEDEKYERLIERNKAVEDSIMNLFSSFISLMKSNGKSFDVVMKDIKKSNQGEDFNERCRFLMYEVIEPLYDEYERTLREKGQMDFTDLVLHAAELCNSGRYNSPYRYILVDEFQDISVDRYKLILSLRKDPIRTKTFCVGDDWQSIYRFSGSDMNLFNHFENYFGFTERCKIETTYRFGNPLVNKSSTFILKNPSQVKKTVHPLSDDVSTKLSFIGFSRGTNNKGYLETIEKVLNGIPPEESVMLLARYNYEIQIFPQNTIKQNPNSKRAKVTFAGRTMDFMSVHAAKGLEADNVLVLNCSQDDGGFPSRITDDPILGFVLSEIDTFEYSEERRLFYVAITRARKHTYVLYNTSMPSVFVTEMENSENEEQLICPQCKKGRLKKIKDGLSINGNPYHNYVCSNSVAGCKFFWQVYFDAPEDIIRKYHNQMDRYFTDNISSKATTQYPPKSIYSPLHPANLPSRNNYVEESDDSLPF